MRKDGELGFRYTLRIKPIVHDGAWKRVVMSCSRALAWANERM